jgi:hypothetical protein
MPNLIPQDIREWMRRMEFKTNDLTRRMSTLIPGDIADNVDLDGFVSTGRWIRQSTTGTTTALHYPYDGIRGVLEVYWNPDYALVRQVFFGGGSVWSRVFDGATWSIWVPADDPNLPDLASINDASSQSISSTTLAALPSSVAATVALPPGTFLVDASVSCMIGSGTAFAPSSSVSVRYWLSGAVTFQPDNLSAGIGGVNQPIASGGGTLRRTHQVTVSTTTNLTITAMAIKHTGPNLTIRDVTVQLLVVRRN